MTTASTNAGYSVISRKHAWALTIVATLTMAVSYVDRQALAALAPTVTKTFDISETQYGFLMSAFSLAYLVGAPIAGALVDRVGARRGLLGAVLVWSLISALHAIVPGFGVLFFLRIALGLAEAPSFPGAAQTVQRSLSPAERARGFGVLFTGSSFGAMIAPPLATFLLKHWGLQAAFLGTAAIGLLWIPLWVAFAWKSPARELLDERRVPDKPKTSSRAIAFHPAVLRASLGIAAIAPSLGFVLNWGAKYLEKAHHVAQVDVGPYMVLPPLLFDAGSILFGHFASARKRHRPDGAPDRPLFALAILFTLFVPMTPFGRTPWESMFIAGIGMAGGGGMFAIITADYLARVHPSEVSAASGMGAAAQSMTYILFAPLIGKLITISGGYVTPYLALGVWMIPGYVGWLLWKPPPPHREEEPAPATA